jgi:DNA invertase Pin-like site-specific DNA recombinase
MRVFGYIRVSKERDDMISPEIQRDEIERYCTKKGWDVTEWFEDLDFTGRVGREKRPGLDALMERALAGECEGVVFYRIDRLSREEADFHPMLAALRRAGIHCDSPANPNDGSPEAQLIWSISAALAKYESVRLGLRLRDAHRRLAKTGKWHGGPVPWGYTRVEDEEGVRLVADVSTLPLRLWMHEKYQQGWSLRRIAKTLNRRGTPTSRGRTWSDRNVHGVLCTPYQVGARRADGELVFGGNVEPLIPLEVYERTLAVMAARKRTNLAGRTPRVALTGRHVRCGTCGGAMYARYSHGRLYYLCRQKALGTCERGVSILLPELEAVVEQRLCERLRGTRAPKKLKGPVEMIEPLAAETRDIERHMAHLTTLYIEGRLEEGEYQTARGVQLRKLHDARRRLERAIERAEHRARAAYVESVWGDLGEMTLEQWHALTPKARRDIYDIVVDKVIVYPKENPWRRHRSEPHKVKVIWR